MVTEQITGPGNSATARERDTAMARAGRADRTGALPASTRDARRRWRRAIDVVLVVAVGVCAVLTFGTTIAGEAVMGVAKVEADRQGLRPLQIPQLPERSVILAADGSPLATLYLENRIAVRWQDLDRPIIDAIVAAEDRRFFTRRGIDVRALVRAFVTNLRGGAREGGSTITQQYVKNLLLTTATTPAERAAASAPTLLRKLDEVWYAQNLTDRLTKHQILTGYLNTVFFGSGAYGIGAAAARYFSTTVDKLTVTQAALLAGLVRSPSAADPLAHPAAALARRNQVLAAMRATNTISPSAYRAALAAPLGLAPSLASNGCAVSTAPFFCEWVRTSLENEPALGPTPEARRARLDLGGLVIQTTLDPAMQAAAQAAVVDPLSTADRVGATVVSVEPGTGKVRAMAVNRVFGLDASANQTTVLLPARPYSVGSTFKAFTLTAALEAGVPLDTVLPGGDFYHSRTLDNPQPAGGFTNAEQGEPGGLNLWSATAGSVNTAFVQLEERVGVLRIAEAAHRVGATTLPLSGPQAVGPREGSLTLGARELTPLEMANSYATLAAGGVHCDPIGVEFIIDRDQHRIPVTPRCSQVVSTPVASTVTALLAGVVDHGTGTAAQVAGHAIAGKTGTTQDFGSAWFIGYTPQLATSVWVGDPRGPAYPLVDVAGVGQVYGGTIPARIFSAAMAGELAGKPDVGLPAADLSYLGDAQAVVPSVAGLPAAVARARLAALGLTATGATSGTVSGTDPAAGTVVDGRPVTLLGGSK